MFLGTWRTQVKTPNFLWYSNQLRILLPSCHRKEVQVVVQVLQSLPRIFQQYALLASLEDFALCCVNLVWILYAQAEF